MALCGDDIVQAKEMLKMSKMLGSFPLILVLIALS